MTDTTSAHPNGAGAQDTLPPETPGMPVRLVRGTASPDELSALIAVIVVLNAGGTDGSSGTSGQSDESDRRSAGDGPYPRSEWSSPGSMVRRPQRHGPGGWRASAAPR